ncbi:hypothetical protein EUGRSUZ_E01907 [Eucalyptus grandis]|uniref:Uncharacterized protein n=1 Tax=Eucalyptus grandis TaxID=71139 RepID=A0ACC3KVL0_EUCGR|nr:hypothetical protein EUGRSUZ_E01907 [Eucalyptus grandis]
MADASTNRRRNRPPTAAAAALLLAVFLALGPIPNASAEPAPAPPAPTCGSESRGGCHDRPEALKLKVVAIAAILATSMIGVGAPLFSREVPALKPDRKLFVIIKAFASGVILATGYMHVMPDSFDDLRSECLPEVPWRKFPFTTFVAMLSAVITLMVDSYAMAYYKKINAKISSGGGGGGGDANGQAKDAVMFEGMGLGGCILQAEFGLKVKFIMAFFFSATTPFGIALGIGLSNVYSDSSPAALIVEGLLNASSAGLLNYMALVDLLAADFLGPRLQADMKLQSWAYVAVLFGAGFMALMAKWA